MKKLIWILILILCSFSGMVYAGIPEGRQALFNNGSPTVSGIIEAHQEFKDVLMIEPNNQEARFFYAITTILVTALENGSGPGFSTLLDVFESFGITLTGNEDISNSDIFTEPPEYAGTYLPPETVPEAGLVSNFLAGPFVDRLNAAYDSLDTIGSTFTTMLTAAETGDMDIEVDYTDILLLKGVVLTLKSLVLTISAYDLNGIDTRKILQLGESGFLKIQRDLLDIYPAAFSLPDPGGAAQLTDARKALIDSIGMFEAAYDALNNETDTGIGQNDDLFSINEEDRENLEMVLAHLAEARDSLNNDRIAEFVKTTRSWNIYDEYDRQMTLVLKYAMGYLDYGDVYSSWTATGPAFDFYGGRVTRYEINGTQISFDVEVHYTDQAFESILYTFNGTLNEIGGDTIVSGTWGPNPFGHFTTMNFRGNSNPEYTETNRFNFNSLYGSDTRDPFDMRAAMPNFNIDDDPIKDTFPLNTSGDVLNGMFPDTSTNDDLTRDLELQPAGPVTIPVPATAIRIDGYFSDWSANSNTLIVNDIVNDHEYSMSPSMDIDNVHMAKDSSNLYVAMTFANGMPVAPTGYEYDGTVYQVILRTFPHDNYNNTVFINLEYACDVYSNCSAGGQWNLRMYWLNGGTLQEIPFSGTPDFSFGIDADFIEFSVPLADIGTELFSLDGKYITVKTTPYWGRIFRADDQQDFNHTYLQIETPLTISGQVTAPAGTDGTILIYTHPEYSYRQKMSDTHVDAGGPYALSSLATTFEDIRIFAFQDLDSNGIWTTEEPYATNVFGGLTGSLTYDLILDASDSDGDGVYDVLDQCPATPSGEAVDAQGCSDTQLDSDNDGVSDALDQCPDTAAGETVDRNGCSAGQLDSDSDGLADAFELEIIDFSDSDTVESLADVQPKDDFDTDGYSNIREAFSGSIPTDDQDIPPCVADIPADSDVDGLDVSHMSNAYESTDCVLDGVCNCDYDNDGDVDDIDLLFLFEDIGRTDCYY